MIFSAVFQEQVIMQFCAHKLDKKDFFGKSDPFLTFYRANEDNRQVQSGQSKMAWHLL